SFPITVAPPTMTTVSSSFPITVAPPTMTAVSYPANSSLASLPGSASLSHTSSSVAPSALPTLFPTLSTPYLHPSSTQIPAQLAGPLQSITPISALTQQAATATTDPAVFLLIQSVNEMRRDVSVLASTLSNFILSYGPLLHTAVNEARSASNEVSGIASKLDKIQKQGEATAITLDTLVATAPRQNAFVYDILTKEQVDHIDINQKVENLATSMEVLLWKHDKAQMLLNLKLRTDKARVRFLIEASLHRRSYSTRDCRDSARKRIVHRVNSYAATRARELHSRDDSGAVPPSSAPACTVPSALPTVSHHVSLPMTMPNPYASVASCVPNSPSHASHNTVTQSINSMSLPTLNPSQNVLPSIQISASPHQFLAQSHSLLSSNRPLTDSSDDDSASFIPTKKIKSEHD
ncbi:hypothetical protein PFISCL1PPCAC_17102, partial [Pristionchus fissidentatus]